MRPPKLVKGISFLFFLYIIFGNVDSDSNCNYITLVKCFINVLDEWAWTLYELKDNVVTINSEQCEHLRQLDRCVQDDGPEAHDCNHNEIIAASNTVSDLLTHRKNSGSFLRSYYLLKYACSAEGQELLSEHRSCLSRERIGEMTLSAGTYLSEKFLEHSDKEACDALNVKLQEYMDAMEGLCEEEASLIMCKSLTNMFKGLHADRLHKCEFNCLKKSTGQRLPAPQDEYEEEEPEISQQGEPELSGLSGKPGSGKQANSASAGLISLFLFLATALMFRY